MKIQCDVCERAEATVLCCADEAALCWGCDEKVHAANKLAGKHQRVPLLSCSSSNPSSNSSPNPTCDICQEKTGYFFCLEDRALLCRHCDVSIHSASPFVSSHQRFLITGAMRLMAVDRSGRGVRSSKRLEWISAMDSRNRVPLINGKAKFAITQKRLKGKKERQNIKIEVEEMEIHLTLLHIYDPLILLL
ncbi:B-box zinc finger protein 22-like isoform X2 [Dioscorea cayenensis subsp. rotundata]|uniref:B-box zinc finger protein 22-like isoform X2 n=1 Tax=Dioscorea cayennensis subsp. rotundata TaxID=55577 RepID=A0AB40C3Z2_DIOCR|nr:B-box zinc finger protein 22-like isoform X2 [Dioscorea cayenensis subsp. rotundata]